MSDHLPGPVAGTLGYDIGGELT